MWEIISLDNMEAIESEIESAEIARDNAIEYSQEMFATIWEVLDVDTNRHYGIAFEGRWYINSEYVESEKAI